MGLLGRQYGRLDRATRLSATHAEYRRAEALNLALGVWVTNEDEVHADQFSFIEEVRTFHTTGLYRDADDLAVGVTNRLRDMAAADLSPWVKLGDVMFRAREIHDDGVTITITAVVKSVYVLADWKAFAGVRTAGGTCG